MQVFDLTDLDNEADCTGTELWGGCKSQERLFGPTGADHSSDGAQWMDPLGDGTMRCMQLYRDNHGGGCPGDSSLGTCDVSTTSVFHYRSVLTIGVVGGSRNGHLR